MTSPFKKCKNPLGESKIEHFRLKFNSSIKILFQGMQLSSNGGLLVYRELDDILNVTESLSHELVDHRSGNNLSHSLLSLLRQSIYSRLAGYEDVNDAEMLKQDPVLRHLVGGKAVDRLAASSSEIHHFETRCLTTDDNRKVLHTALGHGVMLANTKRKPFKQITFDLDSSVSETYGKQEGTAYNGYFKTTCYHPLFCFNQFGDLEGVNLRSGNVHSAHDWEQVLLPIIDRYRDSPIEKYFRGDAAFAEPELYTTLEQENMYYAIRLKDNARLMAAVSHLLARPIGRPSKQPKVLYHSFYYQAQQWDQQRRVIAKIEWHLDELFPRVGFIVTNLHWHSHRVVSFYNQRGRCEQYIKEGKYAFHWTRLSCRRFHANEVRLLLFALAYNMANFLRTLVLPKAMRNWSLTTLKTKLIKLGARLVKHARYAIFQMAEVCVQRQWFQQLLTNMDKLSADTS